MLELFLICGTNPLICLVKCSIKNNHRHPFPFFHDSESRVCLSNALSVQEQTENQVSLETISEVVTKQK